MTKKTARNLSASAWALACVLAMAAAPLAGGVHSVGSLVGSRKATLDGRTPLPHTAVLSGDRLRVNDGLAVVTLARGTRIILGRESDATFWRKPGALSPAIRR